MILHVEDNLQWFLIGDTSSFMVVVPLCCTLWKVLKYHKYPVDLIWKILLSLVEAVCTVDVLRIDMIIWTGGVFCSVKISSRFSPLQWILNYWQGCQILSSAVFLFSWWNMARIWSENTRQNHWRIGNDLKGSSCARWDPFKWSTLKPSENTYSYITCVTLLKEATVFKRMFKIWSISQLQSTGFRCLLVIT